MDIILNNWRILIVCLLTAFINSLTIASGAARIAGVKTKRIATSLTLFNLFALISRLANLCQAPIMGSIADLAVVEHKLDFLLYQIRYIIVCATVGAIIGGILTPTFVNMYIKGIRAFERIGSLPKVLIKIMDPRYMGKVFETFEVPQFSRWREMSLGSLPKGFLIANVFMTAIWTIGVLAAIYVSAEIPTYVRTATLLSGLINGIATVMFTLLVDPTAAIITDQAVAGIRKEEEVTRMVFYLIIGTVIGTILAQFFFLPATAYIKYVVKFLAGEG